MILELEVEPTLNSSYSSDSLCFAVQTTRPPPTTTWAVVLLELQFVVTSIGFLANLLTLLGLVLNCKIFNNITLILLRHQSFVDMMVCLLASLMKYVPAYDTSSDVIDAIICLGWTYQGFYWWFVKVSFCNLVCFTVERYQAVCHPFKHHNLRPRHAYIAIGLSYFIGLLIDLCYLALDFTHCTGIDLLTPRARDNYKIFLMVLHCSNYVFPYAAVVALYCQIVREFRTRQQDPRLGASQLIDRAKKDLTKSAIAITTIFVICTAYDFFTFVLSLGGVFTYTYNTPTQLIGVLLIGFNSCANPVVYFILMPAYRNMFRCRKKVTTNNHNSHSVAITTLSSNVSARG